MADLKMHKPICCDEELHGLEECFMRYPYDAGTLSRWAYALWQKGEVRKALETLEKALQMDRDDPEVLRHCVAVFAECGRQEDAQDIVQSYMERKPDDRSIQDCIDALHPPKGMAAPGSQSNSGEEETAAMLIRVGEEEFQKGHLDQARICFEIALQRHPENAQAYNNLGVLYWNEGDLEKALDCFSQALDRAPEDEEILLNSARALSAAEHHETASQLLELYLMKHPRETPVWSEYRECVQAAGKAWRPDNLDPQLAEIYLKMGEELWRYGDLQGAAEAYARSISIRPETTEGYFQLGLLHMEMGHWEEAVEVLEQALVLDGDSRKVSEALDKARHELHIRIRRQG